MEVSQTAMEVAATLTQDLWEEVSPNIGDNLIRDKVNCQRNLILAIF